jgi:site-specific DNA-cytosine methylase
VPTFGSLFAGIGGIDLGLERAGWKVRWALHHSLEALALQLVQHGTIVFDGTEYRWA